MRAWQDAQTPLAISWQSTARQITRRDAPRDTDVGAATSEQVAHSQRTTLQTAKTRSQIGGATAHHARNGDAIIHAEIDSHTSRCRAKFQDIAHRQRK